MLALEEVATRIGGGQYDREKAGEKVYILLGYLPQGQAVVLFALALVVQIGYG